MERWGVEQMDTYMRDLDRRFSFLPENPNAGKSIARIAPGFRRFPQGSHVVFYRMRGDLIEIVRILHRQQLVDDVDLVV